MKQMGMDRKIEKKKWTQKRLLYIIGTAFFVTLMFFGFRSFNKKIYKVDASRISIKKVVEDNFQDMILIDGDIESKNLVLVNTLEGGAVEEIFIEDGVMVQEGKLVGEK